MKVCIIGAGYVGLTTAAVLAHLGHEVHCIDNNKEKVRRLNQGEIPIYEPKLDSLVIESRAKGRLHFTTNIHNTIMESPVIMIAVGTPPKEDGSTDLTAFKSVINELATAITSYKIIITKSTVPLGTNAWLEEQLIAKGIDESMFDIVSNPEFLREGTAIDDTLYADRIVIGCRNKQLVQTMKELYQGINAPYIVTDVGSAEMIKYASNAFLATKISFMNEMSRICDVYGIDVMEVMIGMGTDRRIGPHFLKAGLGYGGSCFPKDVSSLCYSALQKQVTPAILQAVQQVNESQVQVYIKKAEELLGRLSGRQIAVWGATFKPDTDDLRSSPAVKLMESLVNEGSIVHAYDPIVKPNITKVKWFDNAYDAANDAQLLIIATDWDEFKLADWKNVHQRMKSPILLDGRNCVDAGEVEASSMQYFGVGRG